MNGSIAMPALDPSDRSLSELLSLRGRVAVVTGASRGIGLAIARRFAEAGASVVLAARDVDEARRAAQNIAADQGAIVTAQHVDVADAGSIVRLADDVMAQLGRIDVWANNAGIYPIKPALEMSDDEWHRVIETNMTSAFVGSREAAKRMIAAESRGIVINISSASAFTAGRGEGLAHYTASKFGVRGVTQSLAVEFARYGIRVLGIAPCYVWTPGNEANAGDMRRYVGVGPSEIARNIPLGRIGVPDDVARVALFCASDLASFMTGSTVVVDGGLLA